MITTTKLQVIILALAAFCINTALAQTPHEKFFGDFHGKAEFEQDQQKYSRDLSVTIKPEKTGFKINWKATTLKPSGKITEKEYSVNFVPTDRDNVYSSAMRTNVFGANVALDPLKGDPYVWAQINADTLTVYSLLILDSGGYEMQTYNRTLVDEGLDLQFDRVRNGQKLKTITSILERQ